jgi:hypothetical protein
MAYFTMKIEQVLHFLVAAEWPKPAFGLHGGNRSVGVGGEPDDSGVRKLSGDNPVR